MFLCQIVPKLQRNIKIGNAQGGHFEFLDFEWIPWFASLDPVRNGFSILKNSYIQIFMLSSGSEHLGLILLHIHSTKESYRDEEGKTRAACWEGCSSLSIPKLSAEILANTDHSSRFCFPYLNGRMCSCTRILLYFVNLAEPLALIFLRAY